jgi:hypothetical protein
VALTNLGELASGLAMTTALPGRRARHRAAHRDRVPEEGARHAALRLPGDVPEVSGDLNHEVFAEIRDGGGDIVASVRVTWRLGLVP